MTDDSERSSTQKLLPVAPAERVELLDSLRGFALLGVFLINLMGFSGWLFIGSEEQAALVSSALDGLVYFLFTVLAEGKFYSLFSLLFGIGFAVPIFGPRRRASTSHLTFAGACGCWW